MLLDLRQGAAVTRGAVHAQSDRAPRQRVPSPGQAGGLQAVPPGGLQRQDQRQHHHLSQARCPHVQVHGGPVDSVLQGDPREEPVPGHAVVPALLPDLQRLLCKQDAAEELMNLCHFQLFVCKSRTSRSEYWNFMSCYSVVDPKAYLMRLETNSTDWIPKSSAHPP